MAPLFLLPMNELVSKLQYKTYEKGEFSDEKLRNLDNTLQLIKHFPWDGQRGSDIQPTGPGVVIQGMDSDYLKVALYFNGKFCLYYLDNDSHLYELHLESLDNVSETVTSYFNGAFKPDTFEKHFLSLGNRPHFTNHNFTYTINPVTQYLRICFITLVCIIYIGVAIGILIHGISALLSIGILLLTTLFAIGDILIVRVYTRSKNMSITISKGADQFDFCEQNGEISQYKKSDIAEVTFNGPLTARGKPILTLMEVVFTNGKTIKFPGMLIDPLEFYEKLPEGIKVNKLSHNTLFRRGLWKY